MLSISLKRKTRAFKMTSKFCVIWPARASLTLFPTTAESTLANRLPCCSLDMSGTCVRNLRNFALAGPSSRVPFPQPSSWLLSFYPS